MNQSQQDRIRERAYYLWQQDGGKLGDDWAYWLQAEREVLSEENAAPAGPPAAEDTARRKTRGATEGTAPRARARSTARKASAPKTNGSPAATKTRKSSAKTETKPRSRKATSQEPGSAKR